MSADTIVSNLLKNFTKFSGSNYDSWRYSMETALLAAKLLPYVENKTKEELIAAETAELNGDNAKAKTAYELRNRFALGMLANSVDEAYRLSVQSCGTAKEAWDKLHNEFGKVTGAKVLALKRELANMRMGESESLQAFLLRFDNVVTKLKEVKVTFTDLDLSAQVLLAMSASFAPVAQPSRSTWRL